MPDDKPQATSNTAATYQFSATRRTPVGRVCPACGAHCGWVYKTRTLLQYRKCSACGKRYRTRAAETVPALVQTPE